MAESIHSAPRVAKMLLHGGELKSTNPILDCWKF